MKRKSLLITIITIIFLIVAVGCSTTKKNDTEKEVTSQKEVTEQSNNKTFTLLIPDTYAPNSLYTAYIAAEKGFFKKEGLEAKFTGVISAGNNITAVVKGDNHIGGFHITRPIASRTAGANVKAVVGVTQTTKDSPHMTFVALADSPIKTAKDLVGKKVGVVALGGCSDYTTYEYLRKNGISDPKRSIKFSVIPPGKEDVSLRQGLVDVVGFHGPTPASTLKKGGVKTVYTDYDVWGNIGGAAPYYFSDEFIKENPDVVRRFVKAIADTNNWINNNRKEAEAIQAKRVGLPADQVTSFYASPNGLIAEEEISVWIDILERYGDINKGQVKVSDVLTNEFNPYNKR